MRPSSFVYLRGGTAILVAALLLFLVGGCGGSGGGSGSTSGGGKKTSPNSESQAEGSDSSGEGASGEVPKPVSKKVYVKKADAICKEVPKHYTELLGALEAKSKKGGKKPSKSEVNLKAAVPPLETAVGELKLLAPPRGDEARAKAFIVALEAGVDGLEKRPTSKLSGPGSPLEEFANLTRAYGFEYCSSL